MTEPAKDKAELVEQVRQAIWRHSDGREDAEAAIAALFWIRHGNLYRHPRHAALGVKQPEPVCVNAHDRCYGGAGGPCPLCEMPAVPGVKP